MPKLDLNFIVTHIDEIPNLGDIYDDKGKIKSEFLIFLSNFGEIKIIEVLSFSTLKGFSEPEHHLFEASDKAFFFYYLKGDEVYSIKNYNEQKQKDLIRKISFTSHSQVQFSAIKNTDRTILKKFYVGCTIEKYGEDKVMPYIIADLNEVWDSLKDDYFIRLDCILEPKIVKLNQ